MKFFRLLIGDIPLFSDAVERLRATMNWFRFFQRKPKMQLTEEEKYEDWVMSRIEYLEKKIAQYETTHELYSDLVLEATFYHIRFVENEGRNLDRIRKEFVDFAIKHKDTLIDIYAQSEEIRKCAKDWEYKIWLGQLQEFYRNTDIRGFRGDGEGFTVLLWGCAGRVLVTIQDALAFDNPDAEFGGANITLIFDETSKEARGGVQSLCATKDEALALLKASSENFPKMYSDEDVGVI